VAKEVLVSSVRTENDKSYNGSILMVSV